MATDDPHAHVLEIGPGRGALTRHLVSRFRTVHAIEKDAACIRLCRQQCGPDAVVFFHADAAMVDFSRIGTPLHVVGNLPYNVAAHLIHHTLYYGNAIASCTFMVQREVAHRICALPGDSDFGYLSVFCRFFGTPELLFTLAPGAFFPKPAVHSCVFRLRVRDALDAHLSPELWKDFFGFVKQGFGQRRKKVYNVLASTTTHKTRLRDMLGDIKGNADVRAQQLDVDEWLRLYASCTAEGIR